MSDFRWWPGRGHSVSAEVVVETIHKLEKQYGVAQPAMFVDEARPSASPLHPLFEWDNEVAGEQHRLDQARSIIRNVRVTFHEVERVAPAFLSVKIKTPDGVKTGYADTFRVMSDDQMRGQVVKDALRQLRAWKRRYEMLTELGKLVEAIDRELPEGDGSGDVSDD